jgi:SAM-dependent methyltransferase
MKSPLTTKLWNHLSIWGKLLIGIILVMAIYYMLPSRQQGGNKKESFVNRKGKFYLKEGDEVYDGFYSQIYDYLVYSDVLDDFEIGAIIQKTEPDSHSIILDIGSGTGHTTSKLASNHQFKVTGLDKSESMVRQAQSKYPDVDFIHGDALRGNIFAPRSFTHILCMYFTIYYIEDKKTFFDNCFKWLMRGGYLIVHLVNYHQTY